MIVAFAALFGLAFGSFANAAIDRMPQGRSLNGRSQCDGCQKPLGLVELVPVVSYVAQRGRCKACGVPIGIRTPVIEIGFAVTFAGAFAWLPAPLALAVCGALVAAVVVGGVQLRRGSLRS